MQEAGQRWLWKVHCKWNKTFHKFYITPQPQDKQSQKDRNWYHVKWTLQYLLSLFWLYTGNSALLFLHMTSTPGRSRWHWMYLKKQACQDSTVKHDPFLMVLYHERKPMMLNLQTSSKKRRSSVSALSLLEIQLFCSQSYWRSGNMPRTTFHRKEYLCEALFNFLFHIKH